MEALQHGASMVGAPYLVCANHRNLRRAVELHNSSSQAFQLKACGESKLRVRASSSIAKSSADLAMSNFHAQSLQALYDAQMVHHISNSKLAVGHTQADHNMKVQQRQHAALDYAVPDFIPPFTYKSNPGVEEANKAAVKWAVHHFESILSPENFHKLIYGAKFHHLAGAIYTDAPISRLEFAIEFLTWLYVLDDESLLQRSSVQELVQFQLEIQLVIMSGFPQDKSLQDNLEKCVSIKLGNEFATDFVDNVLTQATGKDLLGTAGYGEPLSPIASAFQDLWIRAISVMPEGWSLRFAKVLQRDVFANFLESLNLHHNICPSVSAYTQERRSNGIVIPPIVLQEFLQDVFLPDSVFDSLPMQRLIDATADVICWDNDIW
ncbi:hypothetical protein BDL97_01G208900 [Sphagnum fallax]|nr:hypothetical protein BDL97_01G208900 [Sphagnum fallax]